MSQHIIATTFTDPRLDAIRNQVALKEDTIPYLLLPVKIETRFMKVDRPLVLPDTFTETAVDLTNLQTYMAFNPALMPVHEVVGRFKRINDSAKAIEQKAGSIKKLGGNLKAALIKQLNALVKQNQTLGAAINKTNSLETKVLIQLRGYRNSTESSLQTILSIVSKLQPQPQAGDDFLQPLQTIVDALAAASDKDLSATARLEKRQLFKFLDEQLAQIESGIKAMKQTIATNITIKEAQLKQLDTLTGQLMPLSQKAAGNVNNLQSKYKAAEYSAQLQALTKKLNLLQQQVENRFKPKLQAMQDMQRVDARELLVLVNELRTNLVHSNTKSFVAYKDILASRKTLFQKLDTLVENTSKVFMGDETVWNALRKSWDDTNKELDNFTKRITAFHTDSVNEKTELNTIIKQLNDYRKSLSLLKSSSKNPVIRLHNKDLDTALAAYNKTLKIINSLNEKIASGTGNTKEWEEELKAMQKTLSEITPHLDFLPRQSFTDLHAASEALEGNIQLLDSTNAGKAVVKPSALDETVKKVKEHTASRLAAAAPARPGTTVEESKSVVLATPTITRDELWVRIYPDDIAVHTHEEPLTPEEAESGKAYWLQIWAAGDDAELKLAAWRAITASYGPQRAAWVVRSLQPAEDASINPVKTALFKTSANTLDANKELEKLYTILNKPAQPSNVFVTLGQAYPVLNNVHNKLKNIKSGNITLLLKTQQWLFKIRSLLQKILIAVKQMPEPLRAQAAQGLRLLQEVLNNFNSVTQRFQTIEKVSSKDIIQEIPVAPHTFPEVELKDSAWTQVPHSRVMPNQFVVLTMRNGTYRHVQVTNTIPVNLPVGVHPSMVADGAFQFDEDNNLIIDDSIKWLTDFNDAISKGMALSIVLDDEDVEQGFDKIFVLGVRDETPETTKKLLEDLIDNHHFIPEGASFLPIGTATNNTEKATSGYRKLEEDAALSFAVERNNELPLTHVADPGFPTDSECLAEALGIDASVLIHLDYNDRTEVAEALTFNKALFHGTVANFMEEALDSLFNRDNERFTKTFFNNYVSGRGFLPALRIGTQPYGILPVTSFSRYSVTANDAAIPQLTKEDFNHPAAIEDELEVRYNIRLKQLLSLLDVLWTDIRNNKVLYAGNTDPNDPQAHFMTMLGLNALSQEYFYRYGVNVAARQGIEEVNINFTADDPWGPVNVAAAFGNQVFSGYYYKSDKFADEQNTYTNPLQLFMDKWNRINIQFNKARVFTMRHLQNQSQILGDKIDNTELSETLTPPADPNAGTAEDQLEARQQLNFYIDWLLDQNPWDVHAENKFSKVSGNAVTAGMPSQSLLFLLLRHSVLSAYADTILKILEFEGLTDQETIKKMGSPGFYYQKYAQDFSYVTKWTYLFSKIAKLNGVLDFKMDTSNSFYVYMNSLSGSSDGYLNRYISPESTHVFTNYPNHAAHQPFIDELNETKEAIRKLKDIPTQRLEILLREHLDVCTYRLDAWRLGQVNKRLKENRKTNETGIYLGAYGWVENLKKGGERIPAADVPAELWKTGDEPVFTDADNLGFIHTPSLNHAVTAAILRAGYHANIATDEVDNLLAVNLSSERVRTALNLINGIRSGQDTASMLGYQFERGLHERYLHINPPLELDEYIYDFRETFPLTLPVDENVALGDVSLTQVVNGMDLLETAQDFITSKGGPPLPGDNLYQSLKTFEADWWAHVNNANISAATDMQKDAMLKEIDRMADAFDALGDLCISESIYQVSKGNYTRSSAIMDKLAKGDVPFDIEIADTPRTGTVVTHKAAIFIDLVQGIDHVLTGSGADATPLTGAPLATAISAAGATAPQWSSSFTPRALAEPSLNKWAGMLIGNPAEIKCLVTYIIEDVLPEPVPVTVTLANLEIQPLDVLYLFGTGPLDGGAELNARIAAYVRKTIVLPAEFIGTADDIVLNIKYTERSTDWAASDFSFYEKAGYIQSIRELMTNSAALAADDLLIPGVEEVPDAQVRNLQPDELAIRITNLHARMQMALDAFNDFFTTEIALADAAGHTFTNEQIDNLRLLLNDAAAFGVPGTVPETAVSYGDTVGMILLSAADGAAKAMATRLAQAGTDINTGTNTALSPDVRVQALTEAAKKILGRSFVTLPHFKLRNFTDLSTQHILPKEKGLLKSASPFAMEEWSQGIARVRQRLATLETVEMWATNFNITIPAKKPFQFPFTLDTAGALTDPWLGIAFPDSYQPEEDKLSLILMNAETALAGLPGAEAAGLMIDEWVEIIPNTVETTGITFNYDQPDAKAPNTILLAVSPEQTGKWSWDNLAETLNDTLEMAKNRAVEPEHLEDTVFGQILPAILTEVVPPQLLPDEADDSGDAQDNPLGLQVVTDFGVVNNTYEPEQL